MRSEPAVIIDGAHNPQGVAALAGTLREIFPSKKFRFIIGMLSDKDYRTSLLEVAPLAKHFAAIAPPGSRALSSEKLAGEIRALTGIEVVSYGSPADAVAGEISVADPDDVICVFGSLYQIGEIREFFGK